MLSKAAFNGLLKTLEEPPEHVKFVFATTEIRKVPVTILSRCQRFDLRRIEAARSRRTVHHHSRVRNRISADPECHVDARACGRRLGARRLSLLDRAIAHGGGVVEVEAVRARCSALPTAPASSICSSISSKVMSQPPSMNSRDSMKPAPAPPLSSPILPISPISSPG
jgi:DNA polymerase III gamma/tau subunit